jgi:hypothetical protein
VTNKNKDNNRNDKVLTRQRTTGSLGTSGSTNLTSASSGVIGDGSSSHFPQFHEEKSWSSKTTATVDPEDILDPS